MPSTLLYGARTKYYPIYVKIPWSRRFQHNTPRHGWIQWRNGCMTVGMKRNNNMLSCTCLPFLWEIKGNCFIVMNGLRGEGNTGRAQVLEENPPPDERVVFCLHLFTSRHRGQDSSYLICGHLNTHWVSHCKSVEEKTGFFTAIYWI